MAESEVVEPSAPGIDTADSDAELAHLRACLSTLPLPVRPRKAPPPPNVPFEALLSIPGEARRAIEAAALEANDRYLDTFLEPNSFCPFSRGGRQRGLTHRVVHYADAADVTPLFEHMAAAARDPNKVVVQIIMPLIETSAEAWSRFCHELTAAGNELLRDSVGAEVFAVAPLHPDLPYTDRNPLTLIPLFRRTPDPTIQWVRLDALKKLYQGRSGASLYVDPDDLEAFLAKPRRQPLFDRIAETNMMMAKRLGIAEIERALRELSRKAQERYARILLSEAPRLPIGAPGHCPHHRHVPATDVSPPRPALLERDGRWALVRVDDLEPRVPRRFLAHDVELVAIRVDTVELEAWRRAHVQVFLPDDDVL